MEATTRFVFIEFNVSIHLDFKRGSESLALDAASIKFVLDKSDLPKEVASRVSTLLGWIFEKSRVGLHSSLHSSNVSSIYFPEAIRYTYDVPKYMMVRYEGTGFPQIKVSVAGKAKKMEKNEVTNILNIHFRRVQIKEITHLEAEELCEQNPGYLLADTYVELDKPKK